jgi:hypothetical protein
MLFKSKVAQENQIVREARVAKAKQGVFDRVIAQTLQKIESSLKDADGRYVQERPRSNAKRSPSQNWRVIREVSEIPNGTLSDEKVKVWLKIGIEKQAIAEDAEGNPLTEVELESTKLIETLQDFKAMIEGIRDNRDSDEAKAFHEIAKKAAKPKSLPKDPQFTGWEYDSESDTYIAVK